MNSLDAQLNSLLVELNRCLLQYAYECWPYAGDNDEAATKLRSLAEIQQTDVGVLVDVLLERQWPIDFGTYPTEYTAMQYNSIESISGFLRESQEMAVTHIREVAAENSEDAFIKEVLSQILINETAVLDELTTLAT